MRRPVAIASLLLAACFLLLASPPPVLAQVANGDFEAGGAGWTPVVPANWSVTFPVAGGNPNGHALLRSPFGNSGGEASITQTFTCGSDPLGTCLISVDYFLDSIDASPLSGRVRISLDGALVHVSPAANEIAWTSVTFTGTCGAHVLQLALQVDAGNNGWAAGFDNVTAICDIPVGVERSCWSAVKSLYE